MELLCLGVSHRSASVELRERLALPEARQAELVVRVAGEDEALLLATCNRVELYVASRDPDEAKARALGLLTDIGGPDVLPHLYEHRGEAALVQLFRVAASLDSMVVGEPQILGQVKEAFELGQKAGAVKGELTRAVSGALFCAKRVRTETGIGRAAVSMASAAVALASKVWNGLKGRPVLVVGAGEMSSLAARHLADAGAPVTVTNRTLARAQALAQEVGGTARPLEDLGALLLAADVVVCCTAAPRAIITRALLGPVVKARRHRPLFLLDLAVPRDIEPSVNELPEVFAYDVDDIQQVVAENAAQRAAEAARAEALVAAEVARFQKARLVREQVPVVAQLRSRAEAIARAEVERTLGKLGELDEKQRRSIEAMGLAIVNKILHQPTVRLRSVVEDDAAERLADAAAELFGLGEDALPVPVPVPDAAGSKH
jgi:glutamyl-tRNA reductase